MSDGSQLDDVHGKQEHLLTALSQGGTPFGMLPLFSLDDEDRRRKHTLSYEQDVSLNDEQLTFKWQASADPSYGFPDAFDRKIFKIIETLALQQERPLKNPIHFSLYQILQVLDLPPFGVHFARVRSSIQRIAALKVHTHFTRSSEDKADLHSETFHIYDDVTFQEESFGNDIGAGNHQLTFGDWYLESLNLEFIQPVDLQFFNRIANPIASRLYEVLTVKFEEAIANHRMGWHVLYSDLCELMPLKEAGFLSSPQRQLDEVHEELIATDFLDRVEWEKTGDGWMLLYIPGRRALEKPDTEDGVEDEIDIHTLEEPDDEPEVPDSDRIEEPPPNILTEGIPAMETEDEAPEEIEETPEASEEEEVEAIEEEELSVEEETAEPVDELSQEEIPDEQDEEVVDDTEVIPEEESDVEMVDTDEADETEVEDEEDAGALASEEDDGQIEEEPAEAEHDVDVSDEEAEEEVEAGELDLPEDEPIEEVEEEPVEADLDVSDEEAEEEAETVEADLSEDETVDEIEEEAVAIEDEGEEFVASEDESTEEGPEVSDMIEESAEPEDETAEVPLEEAEDVYYEQAVEETENTTYYDESIGEDVALPEETVPQTFLEEETTSIIAPISKGVTMLERNGEYSLCDIKYHIAWTTKARDPILSNEVGTRSRELIREICAVHDARIVSGVVAPDHVHIEVACPPTVAPGNLISDLKERTLETLMEEFPDLKQEYWGHAIWSVGYLCMTSGGDADDQLSQYLDAHQSAEDDVFQVVS